MRTATDLIACRLHHHPPTGGRWLIPRSPDANDPIPAGSCPVDPASPPARRRQTRPRKRPLAIRRTPHIIRRMVPGPAGSRAQCGITGAVAVGAGRGEEELDGRSPAFGAAPEPADIVHCDRLDRPCVWLESGRVRIGGTLPGTAVIALVTAGCGGPGSDGSAVRPADTAPPKSGEELPAAITSAEPGLLTVKTLLGALPPEPTDDAAFTERVLWTMPKRTVAMAGTPGRTSATCEGGQVSEEPGVATRCTVTYNGVTVPRPIRFDERFDEPTGDLEPYEITNAGQAVLPVGAGAGRSGGSRARGVGCRRSLGGGAGCRTGRPSPAFGRGCPTAVAGSPRLRDPPRGRVPQPVVRRTEVSR